MSRAPNPDCVVPLRVLVTDGDNRAALAITRSLGRAGHHVFVGEKHGTALAHKSRYCAMRLIYADPVLSPCRFVESLMQAELEHRFDVIVPVSDITTFLLTRHRGRFQARIPFPEAKIVEHAADKVALIALANQLRIPTPGTVVVTAPDAEPAIDFGFPVVIKPRQSRVLTDAGWVSTAVRYAQDRAALFRDLRAAPPHEFPLMVQERIVGPGMGVFACYCEGRPIALFSHRRLRERPPWGGVSVLAESAPMCPIARDAAIKLLDALGWEGVAMVEFKRDERDGLPRLMEINGRFWGSLQLAIDAGVDFPRMLVEATRSELPEPSKYPIGVRTRWLWGDVDSLLVSLFGGAAAPVRPSRVAAAANFLKFFGRNLYYDNPKWQDPMPFVAESVAWIRRTVRDAARGRQI